MNIAPRLGITTFHENNDDVNNDNIDKTITKIEGHPSIAATKKRIKNPISLSFPRMLLQTESLQLLKI